MAEYISLADQMIGKDRTLGICRARCVGVSVELKLKINVFTIVSRYPQMAKNMETDSSRRKERLKFVLDSPLVVLYT